MLRVCEEAYVRALPMPVPEIWNIGLDRQAPGRRRRASRRRVICTDMGNPAGLDVTRPNVARVYDYLLGGKDNFASDRAVGDQIIASLPATQVGVRAQRDVLARVVRYLAGDAGLTQFLDIGSGLPTADNVHQIAKRINSGARVVYVDNDPVVLSHANALLADHKQTFAVNADLRDPGGVIAAATRHLDWDRPVGLLLCGIVHYILDEEHPGDITAALIDALPSGSYVFIHHLLHTGDPASADLEAAMRRGLGRVQFRTHEQILDLFAGLSLVEPGLVLVPDWRPDPQTLTTQDNSVLGLASVGVGYRP
jgi:S-adenosyl methyltransferase